MTNPMNRYLIAGIAIIAIIFLIYMQGVNYGKNKAENSCKSDKIEVQKIESQNNEKILNENVQVIKRERQNRIIPINDDLKWLRENFTTN